MSGENLISQGRIQKFLKGGGGGGGGGSGSPKRQVCR